MWKHAARAATSPRVNVRFALKHVRALMNYGTNLANSGCSCRACKQPFRNGCVSFRTFALNSVCVRACVCTLCARMCDARASWLGGYALRRRHAMAR